MLVIRHYFTIVFYDCKTSDPALTVALKNNISVLKSFKDIAYRNVKFFINMFHIYVKFLVVFLTLESSVN